MELEIVLHGVLWPTALALAVLIASSSLRSRLFGVALATAFVCSAGSQERLSPLPAVGAWTWIPIAVAAAAAVGVVSGARAGGRIGRAAACVLAGLLAALLMPLPEWGDDDARLVLAGVIATEAALLLPIGMHRGGFSTWLAFSFALAGTSVLSLTTGFAKLAIPCGAVAFACGCIGVWASTRRTHRTLHAGIGGAIVIAACATLGSAGAFAFETGGVPKVAFVLAAIAPLGCWLGEAPPFRSTRVASGLARVIGAGGLAALAIWFAAAHRANGADAYALGGEVASLRSMSHLAR